MGGYPSQKTLLLKCDATVLSGHHPKQPQNDPKLAIFKSREQLIFQVVVMDFHFGEARGGLGGLKLDEIDAANSFLRLRMARSGLKWALKTNFSCKKNR